MYPIVKKTNRKSTRKLMDDKAGFTRIIYHGSIVLFTLQAYRFK